MNINEHGTALLASLYVNAHLKESEKARPVSDFMLFAPPKPVVTDSPARSAFLARMEERRAALAARGIKTK